MAKYYTHYPRTILWLVRGGELTIADPTATAGCRVVEVAPFYIGKFPITNEQFEAARPDFERSSLSPGDGDPATGVSFDEALAFCAWYAEVSRKPMRLPTAVEWEYACRAGAAAGHYAGEGAESVDQAQWDAQNSGGGIRPLDQKRPNDFGLYGMLGGVWEWTATRADENAATGGGTDLRRILMGGSILTPRAEIACSDRVPAEPDLSREDIGFRIVRSFR